jgi:predicted RNA binding protein YcfA (HicA-like mRNA interferase family)
MPRLTPQNYRSLISVFLKVGYSVDRQEGSHIVMTKPGTARPLVIPAKPDVPVFVIKNLLRSSGMKREEYLALLLD